jgi:YD repeat-containing protein
MSFRGGIVSLAAGALLLGVGSPVTAADVSYSYDGLGRLTGLSYASGATVGYVYDGAGNRTRVQVTVPPPAEKTTTVTGGASGPFFYGFSGTKAQYTIVTTSGGVVVTDLVAGRDGKTTLYSVAGLQFSDQTVFDVDSLGQSIAQVYQGIYGRKPDGSGLAAWTAAYKGGTSLQTIVGAFVGGSEYQGKYGTPDNTTFVTLLFQNAFGRAPDASGLTAWVAALNGGMPRAQVAYNFVTGPECIAYVSPWIIAVTGVYV